MRLLIGFSLLASWLCNGLGQPSTLLPIIPANNILQLYTDRENQDHLDQTIRALNLNWHPSYASMLTEVSMINTTPIIPIAALLNQKLDVKAATANDWLQAIWAAPYQPHPDYGDFKAQLYQTIDPRFADYFSSSRKTSIRLDEVRWGGVIRDGIPPLSTPKMLSAIDADYLSDTDVVFGIDINGDTKAYPKRILAWHEMFKDTVGGVSINGVYCTLCGSLIIYDTINHGVHHELGTSGFLYRSNKLMYDLATKSLWNTLTGEPVVGQLVGQGIRLKRNPVVTTTWGEWKRRNPNTAVLSLNTGHQRDYGEGVAYRSYFETDRLMFQVPDAIKDDRIKNKTEVLALVDASYQRPLAISTDLLSRKPLFVQPYGATRLLVLTDHSGANRVYDVGNHQFSNWDRDQQLIDSAGTSWLATENGLTNQQTKASLPRFPAHRAFWFGWKAAYPKTQLLH